MGNEVLTDSVSSRSDDMKHRQFWQRACPPKSAISDDEPNRELTDESEKPESPDDPAVELVVGVESEQDQ